MKRNKVADKTSDEAMRSDLSMALRRPTATGQMWSPTLSRNSPQRSTRPTDHQQGAATYCCNLISYRETEPIKPLCDRLEKTLQKWDTCMGLESECRNYSRIFSSFSFLSFFVCFLFYFVLFSYVKIVRAGT